MSTNNAFEIRSLIQNSQSVLIALSQSKDEDIVAAGLSLYLTLVKMRKQVTIVSSDKVQVELSHLFGIDKITDKISGGNNLVVSMPYEEGSIEKVSYHIDGNRFNLVIEPRGDKLNFDQDKVEFNYGRGDYDVVIVLGAHNITALGELYNRHKNIFTQKPIINIDKSENNTRFGRINIVEMAPISQSVAQLAKDLRLPLDQDAASNLYTGIMKTYGSATLDRLDPSSLDSLSFLGRLNARNLHQKSTSENMAERGTIEQAGAEDDALAESPVFNQDSLNVQNSNSSNSSTKSQTPEDWLKPKIFTTNKQGN